MKIQEGPRIEVLERLSNLRLKNEYLSFQDRFISQQLKDENYNARGSVSEQSKKLIMFAVKEVFPYLRRDSSKLDNFFDGRGQNNDSGNDCNTQSKEDDKFYKEIKKSIESKLQDLQQDTRIDMRSKESNLDKILFGGIISESLVSDSLLNRVMNGANFAFYQGKVFVLMDVRERENISIGGKKYSFSPTEYYLTDIKQIYASEVVRMLSIDALENKLRGSSEYERLKKQKSDLDDILKKVSFEEEDFGFIRREDNSVDVYVTVPEHVLKSPHDSYLYHFNSHKVALTLCNYEGNIQICNSPHALSAASGPFYPSGGRNLCMGSYSTNYFSEMAKGKAIAKYLLDARNVVLHGYTGNGRPHRYLNSEYFSSHRISAADVQRKGLEITNANYIHGGKQYG